MKHSKHQYICVYHTCESIEQAKKLANALLKEKLIACATFFPGAFSMYPWGNQIETTKEVFLLLKTREDQIDILKQKIQEISTYDVPEILFIPVIDGHEPYLQWIDSSLDQ